MSSIDHENTNDYENNADNENNAEAFDEDLLVDEGADDTDVASHFPPDHYEGVTDPAVTEAGDARVETIQERVLREESDPVVEELDRNALAEAAEEEAFARRENADDSIDAQLASIENAAIDAGAVGTDGDANAEPLETPPSGADARTEASS